MVFGTKSCTGSHVHILLERITSLRSEVSSTIWNGMVHNTKVRLFRPACHIWSTESQIILIEANLRQMKSTPSQISMIGRGPSGKSHASLGLNICPLYIHNETPCVENNLR